MRIVTSLPLFLVGAAVSQTALPLKGIASINEAIHEETRGAVVASISENLPTQTGRFYRAIPDGQGGLWTANGMAPEAGLGSTVTGALFRLNAETGLPMPGFHLELRDPSILLLDVFPDGSALVQTTNGEPSFLRKILPSGAEDPAFQPFPLNRARIAKVLQNGDILVAAPFSGFREPPGDATLHRVRPYGQVNPSWQPVRLIKDADSGEANVFARIIEDAEGRILIGGNFSGVNGTPTGYIARLLPNGNLDISFLPLIHNRNGVPIRTIGIQSDGKIIVGAHIGSPETPPSSDTWLVRLLEDGALDETFMPPAINTLPVGLLRAFDLAVLPDDRFITVGSMGVMRFMPDGAIDPTFPQVTSRPLPDDGRTFPDVPFWVEAHLGEYFIAGTSGEEGARTADLDHFGLFKVDATGRVVEDFRPPPPFQLRFPNSALHLPAGDILAWGEARMQGVTLSRANTPRVGNIRVNNALGVEVMGNALEAGAFDDGRFTDSYGMLLSGVKLSSGRTLAVTLDRGLHRLIEIPGGSIEGVQVAQFDIWGKSFRRMRPTPGDEVATLFAPFISPHYDGDRQEIMRFHLVTHSAEGQLVRSAEFWKPLEITTNEEGSEEYAFASNDSLDLWHVDAQGLFLATVPDKRGNPILRRFFPSGQMDPSFAPVTFKSRREVTPSAQFVGALQTTIPLYSTAAVVYAVHMLPDGSLLVGGEFDEVSTDGQTLEDEPLVRISPVGYGQSVIDAPVRFFSEDPTVERGAIVHEIAAPDDLGFLYIVGAFTHCNDEPAPGLVRLRTGDLQPDIRFSPGVEFMPYDHVRPSPGGLAFLNDGNLLVMGQYRERGSQGFPTPFHVLDASPLGQWDLTGAAQPVGLGTVAGGGTFVDGSPVEVAAQPAEGHRFVGWQELPGVTANPLSTYLYETQTLTAVFERIPLELGVVPATQAFVPGRNAVLSLEADGHNVEFAWLIGDDPTTATVITSEGNSLALDAFGLYGGQSMVVRLRVRDGFGDELLSDPTTVEMVSPFAGREGTFTRDPTTGPTAVISGEYAYSSIIGWFYHSTYPWVYQPDLGWLHASPSLQAANFHLWWSEGLGWLLVPANGEGAFLILNNEQWSSFHERP